MHESEVIAQFGYLLGYFIYLDQIVAMEYESLIFRIHIMCSALLETGMIIVERTTKIDIFLCFGVATKHLGLGL